MYCMTYLVWKSATLSLPAKTESCKEAAAIAAAILQKTANRTARPIQAARCS